MMKICIVQPDLNAESTYPFEFSSSAAALDADSDAYAVEGPIEVKGLAVRTGDSYRVEGTICFAKAFLCDRCLEPSRSSETLAFSEEYKKAEDGAAQDETAASFSGDFIDIEALVRDTILLAQPLHQLCGPDCRGLCQKCGANLNYGECGCDRHIADPRLAVLKEILHKNQI